MIDTQPEDTPAPLEPLAPAPKTEDGHVSRLEVLLEMLEDSRAALRELRTKSPERAYLASREQREILAEIAQLQGNGQVKGVTLADQLAEVRARRRAASAAS
ncbi:hypothetical protein SCB71_06360 [Herbiconiux sp. KACC 21604]|uniref:hypothetical protein n=1 Tax=unclassified Herbiconiux TaxID=2618217 RepID=UPI0014929A63|nr:hypothetical protein [Herbiconiux sp. SALV-R1]QJU52940.1 hypothetical protein HL652_04345 [Herbiconiux sp. SALV-R1]WPO87861.1 hypothetical protein SCB71_06360 [Herbiconiux sp. KACC 21604]